MESWAAIKVITLMSIPFAALIPFSVFIAKPKYFKINPAIALYILFSVVMGVWGHALVRRGMHNLFLVSYVPYFEIGLIGWVYLKYLNNRIVKVLTIIMLSALFLEYFCNHVFDFYFLNIYKALHHSGYAIPFLLLSIVWYYELITQPKTKALLKYPPFIFISSFFIYFGLSFFSMVLWDVKFDTVNIWLNFIPDLIFDVVNLLLNGLIGYGIFLELKQNAVKKRQPIIQQKNGE